MTQLSMTTLAIPALKRFSAKASVYPFADLVVGGECLLDTDVTDPKKAHSRVSSALTAYKKRSGNTAKFTVRGVQVPDETGAMKDAIAVWKTAEAAAPATATA